jgi:hypothetical protein
MPPEIIGMTASRAKWKLRRAEPDQRTKQVGPCAGSGRRSRSTRSRPWEQDLGTRPGNKTWEQDLGAGHGRRSWAERTVQRACPVGDAIRSVCHKTSNSIATMGSPLRDGPAVDPLPGREAGRIFATRARTGRAQAEGERGRCFIALPAFIGPTAARSGRVNRKDAFKRAFSCLARLGLRLLPALAVGLPVALMVISFRIAPDTPGNPAQ